ncbi:MAG: 2OG-Fe(II) oxygenase family protein [Polaribacter sp.]|uniref:2OG-Fe(II) oxygenase family protein n=1 Tax=Polaribacter sp. TaxID=1920175 RepID=UPI003262E30F
MLFDLKTTSIKKSNDESLKKAFKRFLERPTEYRKEFLQTHYDYVFDGYSYLGQKDSKNQYETDLLHSFVLSKFTTNQKFPKEFQSFLTNEWKPIVAKVKEIELEVIKQLNIPDLKDFYTDTIGHMVSCNYYPKINRKVETAKLRLSKHKDVSLFTVFVFGVANGFSYENSLNEKLNLGSTDNIIIFPGYLLEFLTERKYKALEHQVDFTQKNEERFSFAFFSIPKPNQDLIFNNTKFTSDFYYNKYLSLF